MQSLAPEHKNIWLNKLRNHHIIKKLDINEELEYNPNSFFLKLLRDSKLKEVYLCFLNMLLSFLKETHMLQNYFQLKTSPVILFRCLPNSPSNYAL
jgi:hypothetical protein